MLLLATDSKQQWNLLEIIVHRDWCWGATNSSITFFEGEWKAFLIKKISTHLVLTLTFEIWRLYICSCIAFWPLNDTKVLSKSANLSKNQKSTKKNISFSLTFSHKCDALQQTSQRCFYVVWFLWNWMLLFPELFYQYSLFSNTWTSCNTFEDLVKFFSSLHDIQSLSFLCAHTLLETEVQHSVYTNIKVLWELRLNQHVKDLLHTIYLEWVGYGNGNQIRNSFLQYDL